MQSLLSTAKCCNACRRKLIIGLTSAASPSVHRSSTCKVGQKLGGSLLLLTCFFLLCLSWLLQLVSSSFTTNTDDVKIKFYTYFSLCLSCSHHIFLFLYSSTGTTCVQQCYNVWTNMGYYLRSRLTLRRLMSYIYGAPILDVSRSHTTTQHSR